jgi:hypothetical protein
MEWKPIDTAPWSEFVLVYRPKAPIHRRFSMDIRRPDQYNGGWQKSRSAEPPLFWCLPTPSAEKNLRLSPVLDIQMHEILSIIDAMDIRFDGPLYERLPDGVKRHFKSIPPSTAE